MWYGAIYKCRSSYVDKMLRNEGMGCKFYSRIGKQ
jgi:hypothetical protein